jgi:hypothetical protein
MPCYYSWRLVRTYKHANIFPTIHPADSLFLGDRIVFTQPVEVGLAAASVTNFGRDIHSLLFCIHEFSDQTRFSPIDSSNYPEDRRRYNERFQQSS